jgi:hypothetical protein
VLSPCSRPRPRLAEDIIDTATVAITEVATGIIGRTTGAMGIIGRITGAMGIIGRITGATAIIGHTMGAMVRPFTLPYHQFRSPSAVADTGNPTR